MKTNPKNILGLVALGLTLFINIAPTWAGKVGAHAQVAVGTNQQIGWYASGSMVGARYSADRTQSIGCSVWSIATPTFPPSVSCSARDSQGVSFHCNSYEPSLVGAVQGMTDSSYIYFEGPYQAGLCSRILIYHGSDNIR